MAHSLMTKRKVWDSMAGRNKYLPTGAFHPTFQKYRMRLHQPVLDACLAVIPKGKTVVDIGCACGAYVKAFRENGYDAWGVEGTPGIEKKTNNVYGLDLTTTFVLPRLQADWGICNEDIFTRGYGQSFTSQRGRDHWSSQGHRFQYF